MLFWQFSNIIIYVKIVGKIQDQHLRVGLFSNPGDKVQILVESTGQICPVVFHLFWTLSPGFENKHTIKCWSGIFPTILTYIIMLENCENNISVYGCSPIQGTTFDSYRNLMKPGSQSGTYSLFLSLLFDFHDLKFIIWCVWCVVLGLMVIALLQKLYNFFLFQIQIIFLVFGVWC